MEAKHSWDGKCNEHEVRVCKECGLCPVHTPITDRYPTRRDTQGRTHYEGCNVLG